MLNHKVKSTRGFAIQTVLLDLQGGLLALAQQALDAFALRVCAALRARAQLCAWQAPCVAPGLLPIAP